MRMMWPYTARDVAKSHIMGFAWWGIRLSGAARLRRSFGKPHCGRLRLQLFDEHPVWLTHCYVRISNRTPFNRCRQ